MSYREYCKYLQDKYGVPQNSYYNEQYNKNRNSRTSEGLVIHHICEDIKPNLSNKEVAKSCDFSYQLPENLCYCDYLEHLFLHILITEYPNEETDDVVGIGGSANYLIPELNNLFSGYIPEQPSKKYVIDCFDRVKDDFITYKYLISRFLSNNDVQKERLVSVVLSGDDKHFNEESKIYSELKNICDSGSCVQSHNIEIYSKVESLLNAQNKALLVLGTGLGKTSTALSYALKYGYRVLVVCPRDNIKDTWEIYSPVVSTISYVSLANEAETFDYSKYDLIVFDEAHHLNAPIWGKGIRHLLDNNVNIKILGLTATPLCDSGKKNIADIFFKDCTVVGYDAIEGIKAGVLHPVSYVCSFYTKPKEIDDALEKCKESTDELTMKLKGRLNLALNNTPTLKEIITSNMPHGNRKGIIFAQTIEDMDEAIKILKDIYPNEEYRKIHSLMDREEVQNTKEWFSNTDSGYLCTVDMISEGSHYKGVNTIFMFRKTKSGNLFEQQLGRCMTQTHLPNPHCIVFDLVNNMRNVREFTARLADAISAHGIVKTLKGERQASPDLVSGGVKISKQYVVEDYTQDIVDAYDEVNELFYKQWTSEEDAIILDTYPKEGAEGCLRLLQNRTKQKIVGRASFLGVGNYRNKKVICLETREVFDTTVDAGKKFDVGGENITACCKGRAKSIKGYHFAYFNEYVDWSDERKNQYFNKIPRGKKVICLETKEIFNDATEAGTKFGIPVPYIRNCCNGKQESALGYHFSYKNIYDFWDEEQKNKYFNMEPLPKEKQVICLETKEIFISAKKAGEKFNICHSNITACCRKRVEVAGGFHWAYFNDYITWNKEKQDIYLGKKPVPQSKEIICLETKEIFNKIIDASKKFNIGSIAIVMNCKNKSKAAGGYHFAYLNDYNSWDSERQNEYFGKERVNLDRRVICLETKEIFENATRAEEKFGFCHGSVSSCCKEKTRSVGGYHFAYITTYNLLDNDSRNKYFGKSPNPGKRKIRCVETSVVFESISTAERETGITTICYALQDCEKRTAGGYHWEYVEDDDSIV